MKYNSYILELDNRVKVVIGNIQNFSRIQIGISTCHVNLSMHSIIHNILYIILLLQTSVKDFQYLSRKLQQFEKYIYFFDFFQH